MHGCFYRLYSNMWKQIQQLGFQERWIIYPKFALHLRMISILLFVSLNDVQNSFDHLAVLICNQYGNGADGVLTEWELYKMKVTTNLIHKEEDSLIVTSVSS